ncbi:MAG TPA: permease, partial [Pseudonocardiaceae bacterium]|nr:permease [Pseudonocardiaceae bacterium]
QAFPFLVFGVLISGLIAAFVPPQALRRLLPRNQAAAVPVAGLAGVALPGCECASVPVSRRLMQQGVPPAAAIAFLLAAPAVNPVVLVSTAVAFPGEPRMVVARFLGSLATAVVMGWLWVRFGRLVARQQPAQRLRWHERRDQPADQHPEHQERERLHHHGDEDRRAGLNRRPVEHPHQRRVQQQGNGEQQAEHFEGGDPEALFPWRNRPRR